MLVRYLYQIFRWLLTVQLLFPDKESKTEDLEVDLKSQAERRKSCLDHHWAIPSKDRYGDVCLSVCLSVVAPAHLSTQKNSDFLLRSLSAYVCPFFVNPRTLSFVNIDILIVITLANTRTRRRRKPRRRRRKSRTMMRGLQLMLLPLILPPRPPILRRRP